MKNLIKTSLIAALAAAMAVTSLTPASAMPMAKVTAPQASEVQQVQYYRDRDYRRGYYHGHRGYRDRREGYRRHSDGWWYPLAAFGAAAIIGGAIASQPRAYSGGSHTQWCASRYRSYRAYDNTYVPRRGVRAQCMSPYN